MNSQENILFFWEPLQTHRVPLLTFHPLCERYEGEVSRAKGWFLFQHYFLTPPKMLSPTQASRWHKSNGIRTLPTLFCRSVALNPKPSVLAVALSRVTYSGDLDSDALGAGWHSLLSHNCSDRIGSEMCAGLKIGLSSQGFHMNIDFSFTCFMVE